MAIRRKLKADEIDRNPHAVWNAFIDILAMEDYRALSSQQRLAHLVFWYDSEVQNGGHFQYFENHGTNLARETISALRSLGASGQADVLKDAVETASVYDWQEVSSVEEFVEEALSRNLSGFDTAFHDCNSTINEILEKHLEANKDLYVDT